MPEAINSFHVILTLVAFGILVGLGWGLVQRALGWTRVSAAFAVICVLILILAWVIK